MHSHVVSRVDMLALRRDKDKAVFNLKDCPGPDCGLALEQNYEWVMELCATLAGVDAWPPHKAFKAGRHQVFALHLAACA